MKHIKGLDTLRAFAVLFVIIDHWGPRFDDSHPLLASAWHYLVPDGQWGVDLFFVLSGFLITSILLQARFSDPDTNRLHIIGNFIVRRALRIFPIYYLMLALLALLSYETLRENILWYLTYTSNILFYRQGQWGPIPHTWSLAVEEQFYLIWPWLIIFLNKKYLKYLFAAAFAVSIAGSYYVTDVVGKGSYPVLLQNCLGCFAIGGAYAYARLNEETCRKFERALLPVFFISLAVYFKWKQAADAFWHATTFLFRIIDGFIALELIVLTLNAQKGWLKKYVLENRFLNFIGKISYGIYLYHYAFGRLYDGYIGRVVQHHPSLQFIGGFYFSYFAKLVILIVMCWLSYVIIETPILKLKSRFKYTAAAKSPVTATGLIGEDSKS